MKYANITLQRNLCNVLKLCIKNSDFNKSLYRA